MTLKILIQLSVVCYQINELCKDFANFAKEKFMKMVIELVVRAI